MSRLLVILFLCCQTILSVAQQQQRLLATVDSLLDAGQFDAALSRIRTEQQTNPSSTTLLRNMEAEVLIKSGRLDDAEKILGSMNEQDEWAGTTEINRGFLSLNRAQYENALEHLEKAMSLFQQRGKTQTLEAARCLATMSLVYWSTGKVSQAEENGRLALQIRQTVAGEESEEVAASYNDLGLLYTQTDTDKALGYYEKALAIYRKKHGDDHPKIAIANTNIGFQYKRLKLYGDAISNFEDAARIWKKRFPNGHPNQALVAVDLGLTYQQMGNLPVASEFFTQALTTYRTFYGKRHPDIANVLNQLGLVAQAREQFDQAIDYFQQALVANARTFDSADPMRNPGASDYYGGFVMLYSLRLKAEALEARHFGKTLKVTDLTSALNCLATSDTLINEIRNHSQNENDKIELGNSAAEVYETGVRIAHALSEMTLDVRKYQELAFGFAERSKSAVLLSSIADAEAKSFAGIPPALLAEENQLKNLKTVLTQKLAMKPDAAEEQQIREALRVENDRYRQFIQKLEKDYPEYYNLKFNTRQPGVRDIQQQLSSDQAVVSYFIAEKSQRLYSFVITPSRFKVYSSTLPTDFDRIVRGFNNSLYFSVYSAYRDASSTLTPLLLRGWPRQATDVVVIPSGRLSTLPFEALATKLTRQSDFKGTAYLISQTAIRYEFAAALITVKSRTARNKEADGIFLCAPVTFQPTDQLAELPATREEVSSIAKLFPGKATIVSDHDAKESVVKSNKLSGYRYIHLATHGIVDEASPELSRVFLSPGESEDGYLYAGEVYGLSLHADLAVLSACQTGLGKLSKGEGVVGLSRALVYAGARGLIVSYWSVNDASTSAMMTHFYTTLTSATTAKPAQALRESKLRLINSEAWSHPFFWAPFVLIGNP